MRRRWLLHVVVVSCAGGACDSDCELGRGDDCEPGSIEATSMQSYEDCEEDLCGATITAGEARIAPTWHPGEHALHIAPGTRVLLALPFREWVAARMLWHCDSGGRLFVQDAEHVASGDFARIDRAEIIDWEPTGGVEPFERGHAPLVRVEGSASCWIDDVVLSWRVESCGGWGEASDAGSPDGS